MRRMVDDLRSTLSRLLSDDAEQQLGVAVRDAVRPLIERAFHEGFRAGIDTVKGATERAFEVALRSGEQALRSAAAHRDQIEANSDSRSQRRRKRRRVASGTLRTLIEMILTEQPGLRVAEVQTNAVAIDNSIVRTSVGNELRRNVNTRYRREGKRWFLIGDKEQGLGLARQLPVPGLSVEGAGTEASVPVPSASHAA
jgi:hypothetical protein